MGSQFLLESILSSGPITLAIFVLLVLLSIYTWGILFSKLFQFKQEELENFRFFLRFEQEMDLDNLYKLFSEKSDRSFPAKRTLVTALCEIYHRTCEAFSQIIKSGLPRLRLGTSSGECSESKNEDFLIRTGLVAIFCETYGEVLRITDKIGEVVFLGSGSEAVKDSVGRTLSGLKEREYNRLMRTVSTLATTSTAAPFIGLLGTVIGIINAFREIGKAGSADLAFVAPAISNALVATALGLMVAIPALVGFNYLKARSLFIKQEYNRFGLQFQNRIQQQLMISTER